MSTQVQSPASVKSGASTSASSPRVDLYRMIHKTLRKQMFDCVYAVGRVDVADDLDFHKALDSVNALAEACEHHLQKENNFVHPAMEARSPGSTRQILDEHFEHIEEIDFIRAEVTRLRGVANDVRVAETHRLYLHLTHFVADNLKHMRFEELEHNAVLWAKYSDAELHGIEGRIIATIPPHEMMAILGVAIPAMSHQERVPFLMGMKQSEMPRQVFEAIVQIARETLATRDWDKLARAIGEPQVPGLVEISDTSRSW
jgi:iron-sulfur cluster repair protein YtfE (RIC family)